MNTHICTYFLHYTDICPVGSGREKDENTVNSRDFVKQTLSLNNRFIPKTRVAFLRFRGYWQYETGQRVRDRFGSNSLFFNAMMTILGYLHGTTATNP